jgi:PKD repeat protein
MKRLNTRLSIVILLLLGLTFTENRTIQAQEALQGGQNYVPDEFIAKFKPDATQDDIDTLNAAHGVFVIYSSPYSGFSRLSVPNDKTVTGMVEIYRADDRVEYAEANHIAYALMVPNDELYPLQWNLYNDEYGGIQMEPAWNVSDGSGVIVAIIDTGIAYETYSEQDAEGQQIYYEQAPDLAGTYFWAGYDFVNRDEHPNDDSNPGHGTHIAGIIAQNTNNNVGAAGVAFMTYLMPVKVLDGNGAGTYADIAEGIIWATNHGAHVINLGLGGTEPSNTLEDAVAYAYNKGVTVIAAAGNDGTENVSYPAAYDDYVIAVGASRYDETPTDYSSYGASLDLLAPGGDLNIDQNGDGYGDGILQQTYEASDSSKILWDYFFMEGTSMAAAHVSAVAALLIANEIAVTPIEVRDALESTAEDKGAAGWNSRHGWGILDAYAALQWDGQSNLLEQQPLAADFTADPPSGAEPLRVQFIDESTGNITRWLWDFGDGTTSTLQDPIHTYNKVCHYTVSLTVTGPSGSHTKTKNNYINAFTAYNPAADFEAQPTDGYSPMSVQFTDKSTCLGTIAYCWEEGTSYTSMDVASIGGITSWSWDFGDGEKSTERNPVHIYQNIGTYTVRLLVSGPGGTSSKYRANYIHTSLSPNPIADFVGTPTTGNSPLTVQFTDQSTGNSTSWLWDFGDGTTSTQQNPSHTYVSQKSDYFTVSLTVQGLRGPNTQSKTNYIYVTVPQRPVADFVGTPTTGNSPLTVQFTDKSIDNITNWLWDFGDGTTSSLQNPLHTYINPGTYTVSLTVAGPGGSNTKTIEDYIQVTTPVPVANFTAEPRSGNSPLTVQFTGTSTGNIISRLWNFGDETTSNERYPSHTYQNTGTYTVSLTVAGPGGSNTKTIEDYIQVTTPVPVANFTAEPRSGNSPLTVQFTGTSTGNITSRLWNFGDETTSNEKYPSHTYQNTGSYTVSLTVTGPGGSNTKTIEDYIQVTTPALVSNFTAEPRSGNSPLTVQFTGTSTGNIISRLWNFGDETTSNEKYPSHMYQNAGSYTVSLTVTGPSGSNTKTMKDYIQVTTPAPVANFTAEPRSGNSPLTVQFTGTSTGNIISRLWNFGDETTSNEKYPSHTYQNAGSYTVSLTVTGPSGSNTKTMKDYIQVTTPAPVANFTAEPRIGNSPLTVQFTGTSTGNIISRLWNFGDGTTSTERNPIHTYTFKDTTDFTVSLTVAGLGGTDTETKTNYIHLNTPPIYLNILMSKKVIFRTWYIVSADVMITKDGPSGPPISGATVVGTWSGGHDGSAVSGVTNVNGAFRFWTDWVGKGCSVSFTIKKVIIDGKETDFAGNASAWIKI